jgi:glutamate decarboxylase
MTPSPREIKTNFEYLRKLFIMPDSADKFVEFGRELLDMIHGFFQEKGGIHSSIGLPELSEIFNQIAVPEDPHLIKDVLLEIKTKVISHSVKVGNPYYIGHMISAVPYFMILLEMIIAALNQNQVKIETAKASSFVERELIAWLHRLIFDKGEKFYERHIQNPRIALGNACSDGTMANLTALLVAREKAFPAEGDFPGLRAAGMSRALSHYQVKRAVILVSTRGHYSIRKAANLLGIGEENVLMIPVDESNRIDIRKLRKRISELHRSEGETVRVVAIVGIAGTTETGNVDPLDELGQIAADLTTHFHVDACWGGSALLVDEYKPLFRGIEKADSVSIDAHKLLYCPMSLGMVLFNNERDLNVLRHASNYIIRRNSVDTGRFTIEGSRPFSCLKPWAALKVIGREGYGLLFKRARQSTEEFEGLLNRRVNFEILNTPQLFILNYRFIPGSVKQCLHRLQRTPSGSRDLRRLRENERAVRKINRIINALNVKLHKALRQDDTTFVSRTTLESTRYRPQNIVVLRAVLINPLTDEEVLREIAETQNRIGLQLWSEFKWAFDRMAPKTEGGARVCDA